MKINGYPAFIVFTLLPYLVFAQVSPSPKTKQINQIIKQTNVEDKLQAPIEELRLQFSQNPFGLPSAKNKQMMKRFKKSFSRDSLLRTINATFRKNYDAVHADSVTEWLQQDPIRRLLSQETEYYTLQGIRKRVVNKYELEQHPPPPERSRLMEELAETISAPRLEIESQVMIFKAMVTAFSKLSDLRTFNGRQIRSFTNNFRNQVQPQIKREFPNRLLIKYKGIKSSALQSYMSFYTTPAGTWLKNTTAQSVRHAIKKATDKFLTSIDGL